MSGEKKEVLGIDGDRLGDVILAWFQENLPERYEEEEVTGLAYTFAQIADLTNAVDRWVQRHAVPRREESDER